MTIPELRGGTMPRWTFATLVALLVCAAPAYAGTDAGVKPPSKYTVTDYEYAAGAIGPDGSDYSKDLHDGVFNAGKQPKNLWPTVPSSCDDHVRRVDSGGWSEVWIIWNHTRWCYNGDRVTLVAGWTDDWERFTWTLDWKTWDWQWWTDTHTEARVDSRAHVCIRGTWCMSGAHPNASIVVNRTGNWREG